MDCLDNVVCTANVVALPCQRQFRVFCPLDVMISDDKGEQIEFVIMCVLVANSIALTYLSCLIPLGVVKNEKGNPQSLHVFKSQRILRSRLLQVQILDSVVVPLTPSFL